jgi:hypothetical protein
LRPQRGDNKKAALGRGSLEQADLNARHRGHASRRARRRRTEMVTGLNIAILMVSAGRHVNSLRGTYALSAHSETNHDCGIGT